MCFMYKKNLKYSSLTLTMKPFFYLNKAVYKMLLTRNNVRLYNAKYYHYYYRLLLLLLLLLLLSIIILSNSLNR